MKLFKKRHAYEVRNEYVTKKLDVIETKLLNIVNEGTPT